jgi:hypothetical protein
MNLTIEGSLKSEPFTITQKKGSKDDSRIRILVLTSNSFKKAEFERELGNDYGANVTFDAVPDNVTEDVVRQILSKVTPSPHYILREQTRLYDAILSRELDGLEIVEEPGKAPSFVNSTAKLRVWKPIWNESSQLARLETYKYFHEINGYIDPSRKALRQEGVFGWDHLFVSARTTMSNLDSIRLGIEKTAPRQLVISDFVTRHLFYKTPKKLTHHAELKPTQAIEFSPEMSVASFVEKSPFLSNQNIHIWGLDEIKARIINEGVYFKAGTSRPIGNYFSPPFGGIPLTSKKSDVEETVFMMHDLNHHNIPDLIFDGEDSIKMRNVYLAWRMMSEAMTLVVADMLYANTLAITDPAHRDKLDSRIYPLFEALDIETPTNENRLQIIRRLLWANTQYAVLGDDSEWNKLLKSGCENKLIAYKNHFEKFFVGDHVWTAANYKNMAAKKETYQSWIETVGKDEFRKANLILLSDMVEKIEQRGANLDSIKDVVRCVFEEIMESRIINQDKSKSCAIGEDERLSRGFRRYMIGQMSFYAKYEILDGIKERANVMAEKIRSTPFFGKTQRDELLLQFKHDVYYVWGLRIITTATADNYMQVHPIFPPVFINYGRQECKSVKEVLEKLYGDIE